MHYLPFSSLFYLMHNTEIYCNNDVLLQIIRLNKETLENLQITCVILPYKIMEFLNIVAESRIANISIKGPLQVFRFVKLHYDYDSLKFPVLTYLYIYQIGNYNHHIMNFMKFVLERGPHLETFIIGQPWLPDQYDIDEIEAFMPASLLERYSVFVNTHKQICFRKK